MNSKEKSEELKFIINRYDHYYDSVNNKGNFYLAINTFIIGGMVAGSSTILARCESSYCSIFLFVAALIAGAVSLIYTLLSIKPYLNSKNDNAIGSLLFFGDVADYHAHQYKKLWNDLTEEKYHEDLQIQASLLSKGLISKFRKLNIATWALITQVLLITILFILISNQR